MTEIIEPLCDTDEIMFKLQHSKPFRDFTLANGDKMCNYWVFGDKRPIVSEMQSTKIHNK